MTAFTVLALVAFAFSFLPSAALARTWTRSTAPTSFSALQNRIQYQYYRVVPGYTAPGYRPFGFNSFR